jgi:hypothetical protein
LILQHFCFTMICHNGVAHSILLGFDFSGV